MEEHQLDTPLVTPATTTAKYHVVALTLDLEAKLAPTAAPGAVLITLRDNLGVASHQRYEGDTATNLIKFLNTANLTTKSLHKRILEKLEADGKLGPGTVVGAPDGAPPQE